MSLPARSARDAHHFRRSSLFAGTHVHLDEARWSQDFEAQVNSWASSATLLLVLGKGEALLSVPSHVPTTFDTVGLRPTEPCAVFRFASGAAGAVPAREFVQLSPNALFRYYWRRHALTLGYSSPDEHVEEDAFSLLRHVVSRIQAGGRSAQHRSPSRARHRALAERAKALMATTSADPHPIAQVARALDTSPFHLAHVFRSEVGSSPHRYLVQLRLISALLQLRAGARDLSKLALDVGFCHHSHFTSVFRQELGYTPSEVRRMLTAECVADMGIAARPCA